MVRLIWDDKSHNILRLVIRRDLPPPRDWAARLVAWRLGLPVATADAVPQPGDFWLACSPDAGWGQADAESVGWASPAEFDSALDCLASIDV
jgi:hypothetical protein